MSSEDGEFWSYNLTIRALGEIGIEVSFDQMDRFWAVIKEVADGRLTLVSSPQEITGKFPSADLAFVAKFNAGANRRVAKDREVTRRLLESFELPSCLVTDPLE